MPLRTNKEDNAILPIKHCNQVVGVRIVEVLLLAKVREIRGEIVGDQGYWRTGRRSGVRQQDIRPTGEREGNWR